ncbi:MAG: hypothetical protein KKE79_09230 [Actinobacteria bacterium]|nr:hypothetical protein [Actinomycetota bacterium]MCG2794777.1 hypothetical protein [Actinomycetes bacterium]MBU4241538.1 hypothetical protein [Actinomycetota bacterium]MBU4302535.1 hypothetical protein [Actinomycetota bacterium]MBU4386797.1 hypothetical protein [Actinomycetota bacterium]
MEAIGGLNLLRELAMIVYGGVRRFVADARSYRSLNPDERHMFWKRLQAAALIALLPVFLVLGAASRLLQRPPHRE